MGAALIWCAALCALVPSLLGGELLASFDGRSRVAFAAVPWLLIAGLPRRAPLNAGFALGLALPTVALAAWLDVRSGISGGLVLQRTAWIFICAALVHGSARRGQASTLYGGAWFVAWLAVPGFGWLADVFAEGRGAPWTDWAQACGAVSRSIAVAEDVSIFPLDALSVLSACVLFVFAQGSRAASARHERALR